MDERLASAVLPHMDRHRHRIGVVVGMDTVGNRKTGDLRAPGQFAHKGIDGHQVFVKHVGAGGDEFDSPEESPRT
jgi:hypothetical protein